jgi:transposase-like protein
MGAARRSGIGFPDQARAETGRLLWRVDETYVRVAGKWTHLSRAVNPAGATVDFRLLRERDAAAVKRFLRGSLASAAFPLRSHQTPMDIDDETDPQIRK